MNSHFTRTNGWLRKSGQALPMFVFFITVLILFVGLGIDLGFAYITKANLSKAVDAACLEGMLNANQGNDFAKDVAKSVFAANYGRPGRDTGTVIPTVDIHNDALGHRLVTVNASARINTFFIRVLPMWKTLQVSANAQAQSRRLIMSLVLDRSGSMENNNADVAMQRSVTNFISQFDNANDYVSMNSFSSWGRTDVTIRHNFKAPITTAVLGLNFSSYTCSEQGMTNGLIQNESVAVAPGDDVIKAIVFFTDGLANTFKVILNCGARNMENADGGTPGLYDTITGSQSPSGCTIPATIPSVDPTVGNITTSNCGQMHDEAERRAIAIADEARRLGNIVYCVGFSHNDTECSRPALNMNFLYRMANDPADASTYNAAKQPSGLAYSTSNPNAVQELFEKIRADILLRLTQ